MAYITTKDGTRIFYKAGGRDNPSSSPMAGRGPRVCAYRRRIWKSAWSRPFWSVTGNSGGWRAVAASDALGPLELLAFGRC